MDLSPAVTQFYCTLFFADLEGADRQHNHIRACVWMTVKSSSTGSKFSNAYSNAYNSNPWGLCWSRLTCPFYFS